MSNYLVARSISLAIASKAWSLKCWNGRSIPPTRTSGAQRSSRIGYEETEPSTKLPPNPKSPSEIVDAAAKLGVVVPNQNAVERVLERVGLQTSHNLYIDILIGHVGSEGFTLVAYSRPGRKGGTP